MIRQSHSSLQDLPSARDHTAEYACPTLDVGSLTDCPAPTEALLAIARLLGRQAAHAFLRTEEQLATDTPLSGDQNDV